jgi:2'-5' RNA ligase
MPKVLSNSANSAQRRFFIAFLPPQAMQDQAKEIQRYFAARYQSQAAQKSPPHITLQAPFEWQMADLPKLEQHLQDFAARQNPIAITLEGFAAFPPRVIFIDVQRSPALVNLQAELAAFLAQTCGIVDGASQRAFVPHLTVAFRDLTEQNFQRAWAEFQGRSLHYSWEAIDLTLLIHDGHQWIVHQTIPLGSDV